jgi:hypothetical protein
MTPDKTRYVRAAVAGFDGGGRAPGPTVAAAHIDGPGIVSEHEGVRCPNGTHNRASTASTRPT